MKHVLKAFQIGENEIIQYEESIKLMQMVSVYHDHPNPVRLF